MTPPEMISGKSMIYREKEEVIFGTLTPRLKQRIHPETSQGAYRL
jgi:hypothetical protein